MRRFALCVLLCLLPLSAEALGIATADVTLDWSGFAYTTTGSLAITRIDRPDGYPQASTSTNTTDSTPLGTATATASSVNGLMTASSTATTLGDGGAANVAVSYATAQDTFWLYGTGQGVLTVTVPYHMVLTAVGDNPARDLFDADASVSFSTGPGFIQGGWITDTLALHSAGSITRDGVLIAQSGYLDQPTWGPLTSLGGSASTTAVAQVSEPGDWLLAGVAALVLLSMLVVSHGTRKWSSIEVEDCRRGGFSS